MATTTEILADLPAEAFHNIFSFLPDEELFDNVVAVSHLFRNVCDVNPRWLPAIAPPLLAEEVLDIKTHGKELRLHYTRYLNWYEKFGNVNKRNKNIPSPLDGVFSLAPWKRVHGQNSVYPTPWLHRMVYGKPCPTTHSSKASRKKIPKIRTYRTARYSRRHEKSLFFHQRERSSKDPDRDIIEKTKPICPENYKKETIRQMVIQPVNIRYADGSRNDDLPDHDEKDLPRQTEICKMILDCYFGEANVVVNTLVEYGVPDLDNHCRDDKQGLLDKEKKPVLQVDSDVLESLSYTLMTNDTGVVLLIAPHMYRQGCELDWVFSTCYDGNRHCSPWVCSTFQFYLSYKSIEQLQVRFARLVLSSALYQLRTFRSYCDNKHCVMNNSYFMDEMEKTSHLVLCPACIRKLQLSEFIQDPSNLLQNLFEVLQQESFAKYHKTDLQKLQGNVFEKSNNKKQTKRSRRK